MAGLSLAAALAMGSVAQGAIASYIIGVDGLATLPSGTYAGLANPNYQRLTLLYAHTYPDNPASNHYHSKSTQIYTGPNLGVDTAVTTTANNFLPEGAAPPLRLSAGGGAYVGLLTVNPDPGNRFSLLTIEDTGKLTGFTVGSPEDILLNSSGGRWSGSMEGADVHMMLVSASPGLNFGSMVNPLADPFSDPDGAHLSDSFSFTLRPWMAADAAPGIYTARFQLADEEGVFGDSGEFEFRFEVVPEPSVALLGALGGLGLLRRRR